MDKYWGPFVEEYHDENGIRHFIPRHWSMGVEDWKTGLIIFSGEHDTIADKRQRDFKISIAKKVHYAEVKAKRARRGLER
jgi:hypothetical protein